MEITVEIDYIGTKEDAKYESQLFGIIIHKIQDSNFAWVKGTKEKVRNWLIDVHHFGDVEEVDEIYFSN